MCTSSCLLSDIDECLKIGGKHGHHCHRDQKCVNTIGSYKCTCMSGHEQNDDQSCSGISSGQISHKYVTWYRTWKHIVIIVWMCLLVHHVR